MDTLENRLRRINIDNLTQTLETSKIPLFETTLLKASFTNLKISDLSPLELYRNHYALFYTLYKLQDSYYKDELYLYIHFMRTRLLSYPPIGRCRYFNENQLLFCNQTAIDSYCEHHKSITGDMQLEELSMKSFYFDPSNYNRIDETNAENFMNGAWEILYNFKEYEESFKILGLSINSDLNLVKQQFKTLAKKYHPDKGETNHSEFNRINNAYRLILKLTPIYRKTL